MTYESQFGLRFQLQLKTNIYRQELTMNSYIPRRSREERSHRSKSPDGHSHKRKRSTSPRKVAKVALPSRAQPLHKDDYQEYRPLFALYLDVQKSLDFDELTDHEARGRWKSFMKKWYVSHIQSGFQADS